MGHPKTCLLPQAFLELEAKRIVRAAALPKGGEKVKAQIRNASSNLGVDYGMASRAWHGRIGGRAFPKLYQAWLKFDERQRALGRAELEAIHARIDALEAGNKSDAVSPTDLACKQNSRRKLGSD